MKLYIFFCCLAAANAFLFAAADASKYDVYEAEVLRMLGTWYGQDIIITNNE